MFVDASALTAMLTDEHDARQLLAHMQNYPRRITTALSVWETVVAVARIIGVTVAEATDAVERYLTLMAIEVVPVAPETLPAPTAPSRALRRKQRLLAATGEFRACQLRETACQSSLSLPSIPLSVQRRRHLRRCRQSADAGRLLPQGGIPPMKDRELALFVPCDALSTGKV